MLYLIRMNIALIDFNLLALVFSSLSLSISLSLFLSYKIYTSSLQPSHKIPFFATTLIHSPAGYSIMSVSCVIVSYHFHLWGSAFATISLFRFEMSKEFARGFSFCVPHFLVLCCGNSSSSCCCTTPNTNGRSVAEYSASPNPYASSINQNNTNRNLEHNIITKYAMPYRRRHRRGLLS